MQTVNFNCPHCGNLMAVGANLFGRNVRCPHCKNIARAPAGDPSALPPQQVATQQVQVPKFELPPQTEHYESIFGERHEEDVFGTEPLKPTVPPPSASSPPPAPPPPPPAPPGLQETVGLTPQPMYEPLSPGYDDQSAALRDPSLTHPPEDDAETEADEPYDPAGPRDPGGSTGAFAWILLGYGAFATIVACFFAFQYFTSGSGKHPFEAIPDVYGQYEKANRKQVSFKGFPDPKAEVPAELRVNLGGELTVGDLQVTPVAVERRRLSRAIHKAGEPVDERPLGKDTLVLKLHVKNLSSNTAFHPNDPAFNRALDRTTPLPYTALEYRNEFHYGPLPWPDASYDDSYVIGFGLDKNAAPLAPGAEADVFVAVAAPGSKPDVNNFGLVLAALDRPGAPADPFLWRVQLRRGLVKAEVDGREVEMSATTVIGVPFSATEIK